MSSFSLRGDSPTRVMGIVNVTPDSFSDGGKFLDHGAAIAHGRRLLEEGADFLDIGGESTRPGAVEVSEENELARVVPVVEALANDCPVSIDTTKPVVARAAVAAGAVVLNDVSSSLFEVAAELQVPLVAMHMSGTPRTMQDAPAYDDVVADVLGMLSGAVERGNVAGVPQVLIDPGIGFGKNAEHNMALVAALDQFVAVAPVVLGVSRKAFIGALHGRSDRAEEPAAVDDRLEGSLALATAGAMFGVDIVRVHDVRATVQAMRIVGSSPRGVLLLG